MSREIVAVGDAHAIFIPQYRSDTLIAFYCNPQRQKVTKPDMYVLCRTRERAEAMAKLSGYDLGNRIDTGRVPAYGREAGKLVRKGFLVTADIEGDAFDDAAIKRRLPPPPGPEVEFIWNASDRNMRMKCAYTAKDGAIRTATRILDTAPGAFDADVAAGYARFSKYDAAPSVEGLSCYPHVAEIVSRLDRVAARGFAAWRRRVEAVPVGKRGNLPTFPIPSAAIRDAGALVCATLSVEPNGNRIVAVCAYKEGNRIEDATLRIATPLPDTISSSLTGMALDRVWGDEHLARAVIGKRLTATKTHPNVFGLIATIVPLPDPVGDWGVDDAGKRLAKTYAATLCDGPVLGFLAHLDDETKLHVMRIARHYTNAIYDLSPWSPIPGTFLVSITGELRKGNKTLTYESSTQQKLGVLLPPPEEARAA